MLIFFLHPRSRREGLREFKDCGISSSNMTDIVTPIKYNQNLTGFCMHKLILNIMNPIVYLFRTTTRFRILELGTIYLYTMQWNPQKSRTEVFCDKVNTFRHIRRREVRCKYQQKRRQQKKTLINAECQKLSEENHSLSLENVKKIRKARMQFQESFIIQPATFELLHKMFARVFSAL